MSNSFEKSEHSPLRSSEQFKDSLIEKAKADVKQLVQQKVQQFYEQRITTQQLEVAATQIFEMILKGVDEEQIEREIASSAESLASRI
jgi:hypothetical protein